MVMLQRGKKKEAEIKTAARMARALEGIERGGRCIENTFLEGASGREGVLPEAGLTYFLGLTVR
jgi:hypothetical protein